MKTIVTHLSPDLDSIASVWLIKKFLPSWSQAKIEFVPAGTTLDQKTVDSNPNIIHLDTGLGRFDHHQNDKDTCAAQLVYQHLLQQNRLPTKLIKPLTRLTDLINEIDHFREATFPEAEADRYDLMLYQIIEGLKPKAENELEIYEITFKLLDGVLQIFSNKINAEEEIKKGFIFQSHWGKSLALETKNEEASKLALKMGFSLVIRRDPEKGRMRIKIHPLIQLSLDKLHQEILKLDKKGHWYFHPSGRLLLNGSSKNPTLTPTSLSLNKIIEIVKRV
ncbi:hypothetical protein COY88_01290 [Candidatus Roizmanbacteria bacterium CG_4_10_14_0_8_um_filter_35_28]|uniref:ChrB C-terminal domain-containing protein n=3 Tax=Candidatus Roizmaniibacteriota TaxID=1752723 RepID=A0A2M8F2W5_9BACT|nr:MAG: hypothetical protein COX47_04145 [Candidatus Roizmanbacteria bacterium CG23_combo_of_CG06-09_8_20_14_all_35_49]PIY71255.1 MAG: hypothetical protein COY88_01290 [Candidatus Roizmanbacteria bacterium CG_4_10_14_0_8_um_filter_35_28]PJC33618.1 MAG: hypothetical protein CO048_02690 [Candidatus Roizmanbacteria bacterium CG_4_9_14_0_2_um_filter_35_15]PJC82825.1 MAG: hypothetical protein CO006_01585 [Candidatus Roizmanbacteria bacterium CG_4_8_14_3_um_filter_35_14]